MPGIAGSNSTTSVPALRSTIPPADNFDLYVIKRQLPEPAANKASLPSPYKVTVLSFKDWFGENDSLAYSTYNAAELPLLRALERGESLCPFFLKDDEDDWVETDLLTVLERVPDSDLGETWARCLFTPGLSGTLPVALRTHTFMNHGT